MIKLIIYILYSYQINIDKPFPYMSQNLTGSCVNKNIAVPEVIYRNFGKDTIINSRGLGNVEDLFLNDTIYKLSHFKHSSWFPDSVIWQEQRAKLYHTFYLDFKHKSGTWQEHFFLREESGQILIHNPTQDSMYNYDQVLFYYNAIPKVDKWEIRGFFKSIFDVSLIEKQYYSHLQDTLYVFHFSERDSEPYIMNIYISKKYGFVGFDTICYYDSQPCLCETWYSPY